MNNIKIGCQKHNYSYLALNLFYIYLITLSSYNYSVPLYLLPLNVNYIEKSLALCAYLTPFLLSFLILKRPPFIMVFICILQTLLVLYDLYDIYNKYIVLGLLSASINITIYFVILFIFLKTRYDYNISVLYCTYIIIPVVFITCIYLASYKISNGLDVAITIGQLAIITNLKFTKDMLNKFPA